MNPIFQGKINQSKIDYRITIAISFDAANTDVVYLTSHHDGVAPSGAVVIQGVIKSGSSESARADILKGEFTIGGGSVKIVDINGQISQLLADKRAANKGLRGQRIQEWAGAAGMAFADYHLVNSFRIDGNVVYNSGVYTFNSRDIQLQSNVDIFDPDKGNLSKTVTEAQSHIPILTTDTFATTYHDAGHSYRPLETYGLAKIGTKNGFEIIAHNGIFTHATDGPSLAVIERGVFGTRAIPHDTDPAAQANRQPIITEYIYREGAAPKILLETLQGKFYSGHAMPSHWGVGIDPANIDITSFENSPHWNTADDSGTVLRFEDIGRAKAKTWYQNEILRWITSLIRVNNNGSLTLQSVSVPTPGAGYSFVIDESNCISVGAINHNQSAVANIFSMQWGWSPDLKQFLKDGPTFVDGTSIAREGIGKKIEWKMKGVHSGSATDSDIATVFDGLRSSYAAPPITTSVVCNLTAAGIDAGQNVRLKISNLLDANTGQSLNRTFRVDQKTVDFKNGKVSLRLFGAPLRGGAISRATGTAALNDLAYESKTLLSTQIPITNNATTGGTIAGASVMSAAEYTHLGDLSIDAATNIAGRNCRIWIRGFLTINAPITAEGGLSLGSGILGSSMGGGGLTVTQRDLFGTKTEDRILQLPQYATQNKNEIDFFPIKNNGDGVAGLPDDLSGSRGAAGQKAEHTDNYSGVTSTAYGGLGGHGGGGIEIICRGLAFGANGKIITSGHDAAIPNFLFTGDKNLHPGTGGGGCPGGALICIDGNHTPPTIIGNVEAFTGLSPVHSSVSEYIPSGLGVQYSRSSYNPVSEQRGTSGEDRTGSVVAIQYIPPQETAQQDANPVHKLIPPAAFTAADGTLEPALPANQGQSLQQIEMGWQEITDPHCSGYEIQSKQSAVSSWHTVSLMSDPASTAAAFTASQGVAYDIRIRAISSRGVDGHSAWSQIAHTLASAPAAVQWGQLDKASAGIPADSATVGADWRSNVSGVDTGAVTNAKNKELFFPDPSSLSQWLPLAPNVGILKHFYGNYSGGGVLQGISGLVWMVHSEFIPLNDTDLIEMTARAYLDNVGAVFFGWAGYDSADNLVNYAGDNIASSHYYHCAANVTGVGWKEFVGYSRGRGATTGSSGQGTIQSPGKFHPNVVKIRPLMILNYNNTAGYGNVDYIKIRKIQTAAETPYSSGQTLDSLKPAVAGSDVTIDNIAGSSVNLIPQQYSIFQSPNGLPVMGRSANAAPLQATGVGFFNGSNSLRIDANGGDAWVVLATSSVDYNINIDPNSKWIVSARVKAIDAVTFSPATAQVQMYVKTSDGVFHLGLTDTTDSAGWKTISSAVDLTSSASGQCLVRIDSDIAGNIYYWDGIMLEKQVGNSASPSAFSLPSGDSNRDTDWTAPALAAKEPAQAGADVTGTNVALGADTGVAATGQRVFVDPVSGELTVSVGGATRFTAGVSQAPGATDYSIVSATSIDSKTAIYGGASAGGVGGEFASNSGAAVHASTLSGYSIYAVSDSAANPAIYANSSQNNAISGVSSSGIGTGVAGSGGFAGVSGSGASYGADFYGAGAGGVGVRSSGAVGGAAFYAQSGAYLPFTGAHPTIIPGDLHPEIGDILCELRIVATHGVSDAIAVSGFGRYQQNAIGVFTGSVPFSDLPYNSDPALNSLTANQQLTFTMDMERAFVNALGDGLINVCDEAGEILAGDLICVAERHGKGCRQIRDGDLDDVVRSYTVAIAREDAAFDDDGLAQIACFYRCG